MKIAVFVFLALTGCNSDRLAKLEKQNEELQAQLKQQQLATNLDLQEKCSKAARELFNYMGYEKVPDAMAGYFTHYNAALNKCFISVQYNSSGANGRRMINRDVLDVYEGKAYGEYVWFDPPDGKPDGGPMRCMVATTSGETKRCNSSDEFDELIKQYMEK